MAVFGFLPQCSGLLAQWQPIALPAAINWFCYMLLWELQVNTMGEERSHKHKSQYALSLSLSLLFLSPALAYIALTSDFTLFFVLPHYDQPATPSNILYAILFKWLMCTKYVKYKHFIKSASHFQGVLWNSCLFLLSVLMLVVHMNLQSSRHPWEKGIFCRIICFFSSFSSFFFF